MADDSEEVKEIMANMPTFLQVSKKGFTKENVHRLIFAKPNAQDWLIFFMLVMVLLLAWRYNVEIKAAKDNCMQYCSFCPIQNPNGLIQNINGSKIANLSILNDYTKLDSNITPLTNGQAE